MTFHINHNDVAYVTTRRGVNAAAPIRLDGNEVGRIEDIAERLVTPVTFDKPETRAAFLEAMIKWSPTTVDEEYRISE